MIVAACQLPEIRHDADRALALMATCSSAAEKGGADLVCFPECYLQGYDARPEFVAKVAIDVASATFQQVLRAFRGLRPVVVFGFVERAGGQFFNSAVAV